MNGGLEYTCSKFVSKGLGFRVPYFLSTPGAIGLKLQGQQSDLDERNLFVEETELAFVEGGGCAGC